MKTPKSSSMSLEQRAEISASKRYNKVTEEELWKAWYDYYLKKLTNEIIPASKLPTTYQGKNDGFGQYVRARPFDVKEFKRQNNIVDNEDDERKAS